jgi:hypothetical protein
MKRVKKYIKNSNRTQPALVDHQTFNIERAKMTIILINKKIADRFFLTKKIELF